MKFASVWRVLATSVRFRVALPDGSSLVMLKRDGDKMAGHKNRKKIEADIRLSAISSRSSIFRRSRNVAKQSRNWDGKCLKKNQTKGKYYYSIQLSIEKVDKIVEKLTYDFPQSHSMISG